jgi:hypothetical protein
MSLKWTNSVSLSLSLSLSLSREESIHPSTMMQEKKATDQLFLEYFGDRGE